MVRDHYGQISFEAIQSRELKKRQEDLIASYKDACRSYKSAKKEDASEEKPRKPAVRVLQKNIRGKDAKDKAASIAAKWQEKYDEKMAKKQEKEERKGSEESKNAGEADEGHKKG